jgi:hypothetical protein
MNEGAEAKSGRRLSGDLTARRELLDPTHNW